MKFLIISEGGDGIGLACRLKAEGNEVKIWIRDSEAEKRGEGIIEHAKDASFGQVVIADCTGAGPILDSIRDVGGAVIGGSSLHDKLETDRAYAEGVMKDAGITVPEAQSFTDWGDAIEFINTVGRDTRLVFKPEGKLSGVVPSQVSRDNGELLDNIEHYKSLVGGTAPEFTLQEFIEGVSVSTEGWFTGKGWLVPFNHTIERKQFLNNDLGPSGGCTGNVVWPCLDDDPLVQELLKLTEFLEEHDYRGPIDLNCVVKKDGSIYALEFTPRFGYDAFPTLLCGLYTGHFGYLLSALASGSEIKELEMEDGFAAGVRISVPPWPSEKFHAEEGVPIKGLSEADLEDWFYAYDVTKINDKLFTSGGYGIVGVANSFGNTIGEAFARSYERVGRIKISDLQYRTDLFEVCHKDYLELQGIFSGKRNGWTGVDLDGTLAKYSGYTKYPGEPIPKMVERVRRWVNDGREVRIVTARVAPLHEDRFEQLVIVHDWVKQHIGHPLEVIAHKDMHMKTLWDDRVIQVEEGTGKRVV
jgi:phosphoribosylamine-glycine ligase